MWKFPSTILECPVVTGVLLCRGKSSDLVPSTVLMVKSLLVRGF